MANETERDIEKQLRAYARRRREDSGAPHELHPATRRLLQGEVARAHFARGAGSARPRRFWTLRMRLAAGLAGACAVVFLAVVMPEMLKNRDKDSTAMQMAKNEESFSNRSAGQELKQTELSDKPAGAAVPAAPPLSQNFAATEPPPPSPAPGPVSGARRAAKEEIAAESPQASQPGQAPTTVPLDRGSVATLAATPQPKSPEAASTLSGEVTNNSLAENERKKGILALGGAGAAAQSNPPARSLALNNQPAFDKTVDSYSQSTALSTKDASPAIVQLFANESELRAESQAVDGKTGASILSSFRVEEAGDQLRIIDSDGSIYTGSVEKPGSGTRRVSPAMQKSAIAGSRDSESAQRGAPALRASAAPGEAGSYKVGTNAYYFRVSGTNLTLGKSVVFTGNLISTNMISMSVTNVPAAAATFGSASGSLAPSNAMSAPLQLRDVRLRGRAIIGRTNQLEINAHPQTNAP